MKNQHNKKPSQSYPLDFETLPPTPNHNPLIQAEPQDTLHDIKTVLDFIGLSLLQSRDAIKHNKPYLQLDDNGLWGLTSIVNCLISALDYEINHRPPRPDAADVSTQ